MAQHSNRPPWRRAEHPEAPGPRPDYRTAGPAGDWPYPGQDHPSWPAGAAGADWPQPGTNYANWPADADHPGWSNGADQPSWPANVVERDWAPEVVERDWVPEAADPSWPYPGADHPSWPAGAAGADWPQPGTDYANWPADRPGSSSVPAGGEAGWQQREALPDPFPFNVLHQRLYDLTLVSIPLVLLRLPAVKRWVAAKQAAGEMRDVWLRLAPLIVLAVLFFSFMINEELFKGIGAFRLQVPATPSPVH